MPSPSLDDLRRFAVSRSLFPPTSLTLALQRFGFVQADPIRAPARAQDLTLRHRVEGYRAGDLERQYAGLGIEEDFFINYGYVTAELYALMHPRRVVPAWPEGRRTRAERLLAFVRERGTVHPREADEEFSHGTVTNYWGGSSNATTHLLDGLHYRGLLRVADRRSGIRIYAPRDRAPLTLTPSEVKARIDSLIDVVVGIYAPVPRPGFVSTVGRLRFAVPQWQGALKAGLARARTRLSQARVDGIDWFWPAGESPGAGDKDETVRLLSPFDPVVWDRRRFELLWGWAYRFEAYTPAIKRKLGYYALPLLWRDRVVGWANVSWREGVLGVELGFVPPGRPPGRAFTRALDLELDRMRMFLGGASAFGGTSA